MKRNAPIVWQFCEDHFRGVLNDGHHGTAGECVCYCRDAEAISTILTGGG